MPSSEVRIAIVDDYPTVRDALTMILESEGFQVAAFGTGDEFLLAVSALDPHCVLLDVALPRLSGFGVLEALGGAACRFPVILMTASVEESFPARATEAGAWDWIRKPFDAERVLAAVRAAVERPPRP